MRNLKCPYCKGARAYCFFEKKRPAPLNLANGLPESRVTLSHVKKDPHRYWGKFQRKND